MYKNCYLKLVLVCLCVSVSACVMNPQQEEPITIEVSAAEQKRAIEKLKVPRRLKDEMLRLYDSDPVERAWGAYQLAKLGRGAAPAVPHLEYLLHDHTSVLLSRYVGGGFHSSSATTPAEEAARALAKIGSPAIETLTKSLSNQDPHVRRLAAKALGQTGNIATVDALLTALTDQDSHVRAAAAIALGNLRHPIVAQKLIDAYATAQPLQQTNLVYAMAQINDIIVVPFLVESFPSQTAETRASIVLAFGKLRDARAIETLLQALQDEDEIVRANAAYALSSFYNVQVMDALVLQLDDEVPRVREATIEALRMLSGLNFGQDKDKWVTWWQQQRQAVNSQSEKKANKK